MEDLEVEVQEEELCTEETKDDCADEGHKDDLWWVYKIVNIYFKINSI